MFAYLLPNTSVYRTTTNVDVTTVDLGKNINK